MFLLFFRVIQLLTKIPFAFLSGFSCYFFYKIAGKRARDEWSPPAINSCITRRQAGGMPAGLWIISKLFSPSCIGLEIHPLAISSRSTDKTCLENCYVVDYRTSRWWEHFKFWCNVRLNSNKIWTKPILVVLPVIKKINWRCIKWTLGKRITTM